MKFTIIAQQDCMYCDNARALLFYHEYEFDYITLDNKPDLRDLLMFIGFKTVPIIFVQKTAEGYPTLIGTYKDLKAYLEYRSYLTINGETNDAAR